MLFQYCTTSELCIFECTAEKTLESFGRKYRKTTLAYKQRECRILEHE